VTATAGSEVLISVGIPTYNRRTYVMRAIESVLAQSHGAIEIIVSDNASRDDTLEHVRSISDPRVVVLAQHTNLGMTGNFNACLNAATGRYFLMLSDDDYLEKTALQRLVTPLEMGIDGCDASDIALSWTPCTIVDGTGTKRWVTDAGPDVEPAIELLAGMFDGTRGPRFCGILCRTSDVRTSGGYLESHGPICDVGNWGRTVLRYRYVVCTHDPLSFYTMHQASTSSTTLGKQWQTGGEHIFADLLAETQACGNDGAAARLRSTKVQFISGLLATVIMQSIGKPGWVRYAISEVCRAPQYLLAPRTLVRLARGAAKLFKLAKAS
jgi:hypothetical protein